MISQTDRRILFSKNGRTISYIITNLLLIKNLSNHKKIVKLHQNGKMVNDIETPYKYLEYLIESNPGIRQKDAIIQDRKISYEQLQEEYHSFSKFLLYTAGVKEYEKVSICAAGSIEGIVTFFALNKIGAINARIFNGSKEDKMLFNILDFESKVIITDIENVETILNIIDQTKIDTIVITSNIKNEELEEFKKLNANTNFYTYQEAIQIGREEKQDYEATQSGEDLASILYTSGSSGEPKPISMPNRCYSNMIDIVCNTTGIKKCDNEKSISVVSHEYPYAAINCTVMILLMGKTLVLPVKREDNKIDFAQLFECKPDKVQAIPNFFKLLDAYINSGENNIDSLDFFNTVVSGGERYLDSDKKKLLALLDDMGSKAMLIDGFGFGELASATALKFGLNDYFLLMNGIEAKAVNPESLKDLKKGEEGLLCLTGPTISAGYYNNEEATKKSFVKDENGKLWFVSDTYGSVHGMKERLIKLGGRVREYFITSDGQGSFVKVYAGNVEDIISTNQFIKDCIVVPSDTGATPTSVAYISLREGVTESEKDIISILSSKCEVLEKFARPTAYIFEDNIKRTPAGKKDYSYYKALQIKEDNK